MSSSKLKRNESSLWQRRFWEQQIRDAADYETHMDYLHYNPVKHDLVKQLKIGRIRHFIEMCRKVFMMIAGVTITLRKLKVNLVNNIYVDFEHTTHPDRN